MKARRVIPLISIISLGACSTMQKTSHNLQSKETPKTVSEKQLSGNQINWLARMVDLTSENGTTCATLAYINKKHTIKQALLKSNYQPFYACSNDGINFDKAKNSFVMVSGTVLDYGADKEFIHNYPIVYIDSLTNKYSSKLSNRHYAKPPLVFTPPSYAKTVVNPSYKF